MRVLSLFDGMSCGQIALNRIGIVPEIYWASEIDKYAQIVSKANYPNTVYLGDVRNIDPCALPGVDLLIGGSPCQSFSMAGERKGMSTKCEIEVLTLAHYLELKAENFAFEGQSYLFWEYMRVLTELRKINPNIKFLLENVMMGEKWQRVLTQAIGINPICIDSALLSAQNRERLYWTNIGAQPSGFFGDLECAIPQPKDLGLYLGDILQPDEEIHPKFYISPKMLEGVLRSSKGDEYKHLFDETEKSPTIDTRVGASTHFSPYIISDGLNDRQKKNFKYKDQKANTFLSTSWKGAQANGMTLVESGTIRTHNDGKGFRAIKNGKAATIPARAREDGSGQNAVSLNGRVRRLTPIECERLQTVPDNYTNHTSDTQRYKMIGNGWTVDVIAYIFGFI